MGQQKKALITGITGQDGSYLSEFLLKKGYKVFGLVRRSSSPNLWRIQHILDKITLIEGDLHDSASLNQAIQQSKPNEVYNLAAQAFVSASWTQPELTGEITGIGTLKLLEAVRQFAPNTKFYQASSSEMYGNTAQEVHEERNTFYPSNPYAVAKVYAHLMAGIYRKRYGMFICCGILFNHESPRRGVEFVTRKITNGVAKIKLGLADELKLGSLEAQRDWGFAGDYVEAMWLMLQQDKPEDYVISTGITHSVKEFVEAAFEAAGIENWQKYVKQDERFMRPAELYILKGSSKRAENNLGWKPKVHFEELVKNMVEEDIRRLEFEKN